MQLRGSFEMLLKFVSTVVPVYLIGIVKCVNERKGRTHFRNSINDLLVKMMLVASQSNMPNKNNEKYSHGCLPDNVPRFAAHSFSFVTSTALEGVKLSKVELIADKCFVATYVDVILAMMRGKTTVAVPFLHDDENAVAPARFLSRSYTPSSTVSRLLRALETQSSISCNNTRRSDS